MILRQQLKGSASRIPPGIVAPALIALVAIYPAVWNPDRGVRQVMASAMIAGIVWLVMAAVSHCMLAVDDVRIDNLRERAKAELGGEPDGEDEAWAEIVLQLRKDTWPENNEGDATPRAT